MTDTRWLNDAEMEAWLGYIGSIEPLRAALDADLHRHQLTLGDYEVLAFLSEAGERRMRMTDLAHRLRLSPSGLTRRIDGLVRLGYVDRVACASDRRVMYAALTDAGFDYLRRVAPDHVSSVRRHFLSGLSESELATITAVFRRIRERLDDGATVPA